jgi:hypothetical protein
VEPAQDPYFTRQTVELAAKSKELHDVAPDGNCVHCPDRPAWPCEPHLNAQRTIDALTPRERAGRAGRRPLGPLMSRHTARGVAAVPAKCEAPSTAAEALSR